MERSLRPRFDRYLCGTGRRHAPNRRRAEVDFKPSQKARLADSGTPNIDAYDCYLRGRELLRGTTKNRETFEQSTKFFTRALELDATYSQAYAGLSMAYTLDYQNRWSDNPDISLRLAKHNAEQAIEKDSNEPFARLVASWVAIFEKDLDRAKSEADIALSLNPNSSLAYASLGSIRMFLGQPLEAIPPFVSIPLSSHKISTSSAWRTCLLASTKQPRLC